MDLESCLFSSELGYYDSRSITVFLRRHSTEEALNITESHESMHQDLASGTTYGQLLIRHVRDHRGSRASRLTRELTNSCRITQEGLATYFSLLVSDAEGSVHDLPDFYRNSHDLFKRTVEHCTHTKYLRLFTSLAIARSAMMTRLGLEVEDLIAEGADIIIEMEHSPDIRLSKIVNRILSLPSDTIFHELRRYFQADTWAFIEQETIPSLYRDDPKAWESLHDRVNQCLMQIFDEVLADIVPGIGKAYRMNLVFSSSRWGATGASLGVHPEDLKNVWQLTNQNIAIDLRPAPPIVVIRNPLINRLIQASSLNRTNFLHLKAEYDDRNNAAVFYALNIEGRDDKLTVIASPLEESHLQLELSQCLMVTGLDDAHHLYERSTPLFQTLLKSRTLVQIESNPFDFLISALTAGHSIEWLTSRLDYRDGTVRAHHQVDLILYVLDGTSIPYFHLSNPMMTRGIRRLADLLQPNEQLSFTELTNDRFERFDELLTTLADHPTFYAFTLLGRAIRLLDHDTDG